MKQFICVNHQVLSINTDHTCIYLLNYGFENDTVESSLFIYHSSHITLLVLVYVDDLIITRNNHLATKEFIQTLCNTFNCRDLDNLHDFLGLEVSHSSNQLLLQQP